MKLNQRRIGAFAISYEMIEDSPDMALAMLHGMIVLRAEMRFSSGAIHYEAIHPDFDEIEKGELPPFYTPSLIWNVNENSAGARFEKWCRL